MMIFKINDSRVKTSRSNKTNGFCKMLSTQMQMSTISMNQEMIKAMQSIQTTFSQTALSNATANWVKI